MNQFGISHLDSLLNFSGLHLLIFTPDWELTALHPNHRSFLGWDEADFESFIFEQNFLKPNGLDLTAFLGHFQQNNFVTSTYFWRNNENQITGPYETYFRLRREAGDLKAIMAFIRTSQTVDKIEIDPLEKNKLFLCEPLPGLLHNLFSPLGTLSGRLELLKKKNPEAVELEELLKMTLKIQRSLKNLSHKLSLERRSQVLVFDLNQFFREELQYLQFDHFFLHQVIKNIKLETRVSEVESHYASLSGILGEFYYFFRKFVLEDQSYILQAETFIDEQSSGFYLNFLGNFKIPADLNVRFPFDLQGAATQVAQQKIDGLDSRYLTHCLRRTGGYLEISGRKDMMKLRILIPLLAPQL